MSDHLPACLMGLAVLGHAALCVSAINRWHGMGLDRGWLKLGDVLWYVWFLSYPWWFVQLWSKHGFAAGNSIAVHAAIGPYRGVGWSASSAGPDTSAPSSATHAELLSRASNVGPDSSIHPTPKVAGMYTILCWCSALVGLLVRVRYLQCEVHGFQAGIVQEERHSIRHALGYTPAGTLVTRLASHLPGNEILDLSINQKSLELPRYPDAAPLTIAHISDLHLTGQWQPSFYEYVFGKLSELDADLIVITGDIVEKRRCLPWIQRLCSTVSAPHGTYFVLGNHELRIRDDRRIRQALSDAGWIDLGGKCIEIQAGELMIHLGGTERPWMGLFPQFPPEEANVPAPRALRILLSHSPDQLGWARAQAVDLLLAGHTHGGQVRFPLFGPLLCPSRFGVRFASGVFHAPPTVMHVSRGISGTRPLRWNAPPELSKLVLSRS